MSVAQTPEKGLLRLITCGSVDDGKSTLIGRLLYDSNAVLSDQLETLNSDSRKFGTTGAENLDFALLVDGLSAEREQGITIDVAYRFFNTAKRKFIIADTPGHEQHTRNMATGASTASLAILLVDARHGVLTQTRRHSYIVSLLGIRQVVVAINKMDLVDYDQQAFDQVREDFAVFSSELGFESITYIPVSALKGDNLTSKSQSMPWYDGPCLLEHLETVDEISDDRPRTFRLPVQWVNRPNLDFRGFAGTIVSGEIGIGSEIMVIPSGKRSAVKDILVGDRHAKSAKAGQAVTLVLEDEIDISRGDVICPANDPADVSDQFAAHLLWMDEQPLLPGRQYLMKAHHMTVPVSVTALKHTVDVNTFSKKAAKTLQLNEVAVCNLSLGQPIPFDAFKDNTRTGSFIFIDRQTHRTVGAGMLDFSLRRAANVVWQDLEVGKQQRATAKHQRPAVLWFTGLSGSGKSTIANLVEKRLFDIGRHTYILDGDNVRHGLNTDLGFTDSDRVENIRRVSEVARLMADAGLMVMVSFISPFRAERQIARGMMEDGEFIEIHVNTPLEVAEQRDVKGLYKKARAGQIKNFTGIDSAYEAPNNPEIVVNTVEMSAEESAERIVAYLEDGGYLKV